MAITQTLTPFPDPPRIYQPEEEFDAKADEMAGHLPILTTEINALIPQINNVSSDITTKHSDVVTKHDAVMTTAQQMQIDSTALQTAVNSASGSANAAAASATNAANSATTAAASATNAANSATTAATPGTVIFYAKSTPPAGFLKANGAAVSRTTYAALFATIGTIFGAGDGSTTFNLPDLRGEFIRGWDDARGIDSGREFGSAQAYAMQYHQHMIGNGSGAFSSTDLSDFENFNRYPYGFIVDRLNSGGGANWGATSTMNGNQSSETRPRNVALLACIRF